MAVEEQKTTAAAATEEEHPSSSTTTSEEFYSDSCNVLSKVGPFGHVVGASASHDLPSTSSTQTPAIRTSTTPTPTSTSSSSTTSVRNIFDFLPQPSVNPCITQESLTLAYLELLRRASPSPNNTSNNPSNVPPPPMKKATSWSATEGGGVGEASNGGLSMSIAALEREQQQQQQQQLYREGHMQQSSAGRAGNHHHHHHTTHQHTCSSSRGLHEDDKGKGGAAFGGLSYLALLKDGRRRQQQQEEGERSIMGMESFHDEAEDRLRKLASRLASRRENQDGDSLVDLTYHPVASSTAKHCCHHHQLHHQHSSFATATFLMHDMMSAILSTARTFRWIVVPCLVLLCLFLFRHGFQTSHIIQTHDPTVDLLMRGGGETGGGNTGDIIPSSVDQVGGGVVSSQPFNDLVESTEELGVGSANNVKEEEEDNVSAAVEEEEKKGRAGAGHGMASPAIGEELLNSINNKNKECVNNVKESEQGDDRISTAAAAAAAGRSSSKVVKEEVGQRINDERGEALFASSIQKDDGGDYVMGEKEVEEEEDGSPLSTLLGYAPPSARGAASVGVIGSSSNARMNTTPSSSLSGGGALAPLHSSPRLTGAAVLAGWGSGPLELQRVYERAFVEEDISLMEIVTVCALEILHRLFKENHTKLAQLKEGWCIPKEGRGNRCEPNLFVRLALQVWDVARMGIHKVHRVAIGMAAAAGEQLAALPAPADVIQEYNTA